MEPIARTPEPAKPPDQSSECRWWSARRAAAYIGAGPKEIYKAVRAGKLKAVRLNQRGDIRTTREWVDEWMEQKQREPRVM
jgi:excisionase family DNA binding protein